MESLIARRSAVCSVRYSAHEMNVAQLAQLRTKVNTVAGSLQSTRLVIKDDIYLIDRLIYKGSGPFRQFKHFQWLKRIRRLIRRFEELQPEQGVIDFVQGFTSHPDGGCYLCSRENFEELFAVLCFARNLFGQAVNACVTCAKFIVEQLENEHFVTMNLVLLSVLSKLSHQLSDRLLKVSSQLTDLHPWLTKHNLKPVSSNLESMAPMLLAEESSPDLIDFLTTARRLTERSNHKKTADHLAFLERLTKSKIDVLNISPVRSDRNGSKKRGNLKVATRNIVTSTPKVKAKTQKRISQSSLDIGEVVNRDEQHNWAIDVPSGAKVMNVDAVLIKDLRALKTLKDLQKFTRKLKQCLLQHHCTPHDMRSGGKIKDCLRFLKIELKKLRTIKAQQPKKLLKNVFKETKIAAINHLS